jgi:hypothetical protein
MTTRRARRRQDEREAFEVLFCGIPAQEQACHFSEIGLAHSMGWDPYRLEDALARLQVRGVIGLYYRADGTGHARVYQAEP